MGGCELRQMLYEGGEVDILQTQEVENKRYTKS